MIAITGAGGFIGSVLLGYLNKQGIEDIVLFDDLPTGDQFKNLVGKQYISLHSTEEHFSDFESVDCVIHLGANASTLERNWSSIYKTNVLSTRVWSNLCSANNVPFIFASSAAVYGNGAGPLNHYAFSKSLSEQEVNGVVLRLFNVYGPNEYHKGRMASTVYHWHQQIKENGSIKIFENSSQYFRDFVWVEDVAKTIHHFIKNYKPGIYDVGTGISVDFDKIANIVCLSANCNNKTYIPMPADLAAQYQSNTRADTSALAVAGVDVDSFLEPWQGITEYFKYLDSNRYY